MSDTERTTERSTAAAKGFFGKLVNGDFGLAKTYWLYGVLVGIAVNLVSRGITSTETLMFLIIAYTAYEVPVLIGTWRAASLYKGPSVWAILAKAAVMLGALMLVISLLGVLALRG